MESNQLDVFIGNKKPIYSPEQLSQIVAAVRGRTTYLQSRLNAQENNLSNAKVIAYDTYDSIKIELKKYQTLFKKLKKLNLPYIKFRDIFEQDELDMIYTAIEDRTFKPTSLKIEKGITETEQQKKYLDLLSLFSQNEMI